MTQDYREMVYNTQLLYYRVFIYNTFDTKLDEAVIPVAEPALSLQVPKEFFVLWERYLNLCKALNKTPNSLIVELNQHVIGTSLYCQSSTLTKRIKTEFSRFVAKYKNMGGAKGKVEASKNINIVIF